MSKYIVVLIYGHSIYIGEFEATNADKAIQNALNEAPQPIGWAVVKINPLERRWHVIKWN